eukprot:TRINITY_DN2961_c0_g1_i1.p1 TRINITY_DN2961_c0_g1~~TRINITY_DN2961_c0_g1_i1.p1  ORF type:complete len:230 (-),score=91.42 TRINITY_DN2961_c0_g1_i1:166-855(-)
MGSFFSSENPTTTATTQRASSQPKITPHDRAMLDLKTQRDKLKQYQKKMDSVILREREIAKELMKKNKKKEAMLALKKKKHQESLLDTSFQLLENIQQMIDSIEFAQMQQEVFLNLKKGNEVLKEINKQMSVEEVEKLMMETQEGIDAQREIEEMMAGQLTVEDEDEILAELAKYEAEAEAEKQKPGVQFPATPSEEPTPTPTPPPTPTPTPTPTSAEKEKRVLTPAVS